MKESMTKQFFNINIVKLVFFIFFAFVILFGFYASLTLLKPIVIAFIIAYLLNPIVIYFERKQLPRIFVILGIGIFIFIILFVIFKLIQTNFPSTETIIKLKDQIATQLSNLQINLKKNITVISDWDGIFNSIYSKLNQGSDLTAKLPGYLSNVASLFSFLILIPFTTFFFLLQGRKMKKGFMSLLPNKYFEMTLITLDEIDFTFGNYIRGTILDCLLIGLIDVTGFILIGFPIPIAIGTGLIAGLFNIIPYIGPVIGILIGIMINLFGFLQGAESFIGISPSYIGIIIVVLISNVFDNVLIYPMTVGSSVNLHPLIVIFGLMAGSSLFGMIGMLVAIPLIAIIKVLLQTLFKQLKGFQILDGNIFEFITKKIE